MIILNETERNFSRKPNLLSAIDLAASRLQVSC